MNTALWIIQILIAAVFLATGLIKLILLKKNLEKVFEWSKDYTQKKLRIIAAFEIIGAFGLFLPGVFSLNSVIIPLSAAFLAIISILAILKHYRRDEKTELMVNILLFSLLLLVIIGRILM